MTDFNISDMIDSVLENNPSTFKDAFNSVMAQKVAAALVTKKQEVAASMYNNEQESEVETNSEAVPEQEVETEAENVDQTQEA